MDKQLNSEQPNTIENKFNKINDLDGFLCPGIFLKNKLTYIDVKIFIFSWWSWSRQTSSLLIRRLEFLKGLTR